VEWDSLGAQVVSAGSHNCWLVSGDNSTVGVSNQGWDTGEGTSIWQSWGKSWHSRGDGTDGTDSGGNWGWGKSWASNWADQAGARSNGSVESSALGSQVVSPGGNNSWLVGWGHGTIGVSNQLWDTSKGTNVLAGSSNDGGCWGNDGASPGNDGGNGGSGISHRSSSNGSCGEGRANQAGAGGHSSLESSALGSQMVSPGSNHSRLISWGHGTVGVGDQLWDMDGSKG